MLIVFNNNTQQSVLTFNGNVPSFSDPFLKKELEISGIEIPESLQESFKGKKVIPLPSATDPARSYTLFKKAFVAIYFPAHLQQHDYSLITI